MSEEDTEAIALRQEIDTLKKKIIRAQEAAKDKSISDVCSGVGDVPKLRLRTKKTLNGHIHKVNAIHFADDSRHLVSGSLDGKLIVWDTWSGNKVQIIPLKSSWVLAVAYSPSGNFVAAGGMDNMVTIYDLNNRDSDGVPKIYRELGFEGFLNCCRFLTDKNILTGSGDLKVTNWDLVKGLSTLELYGHAGDVASISLKPEDENIFVTGSLDNTAKLWDLRQKPACQTFLGHSADVNCVFFHPSGLAFTTASEDNTAKLFDLRSDQEVAQYDPPNSEDPGLTSCVMSKSGRYLFAGAADAGIHIWDVLKVEHIGIMSGHESRVTCLTVSENGMAIASSSWDQNVRLWL